jgi:threonine synthase
LKASEKFGWYCRNTGYNPYTVEGKKTVSYEICEQLAASPGEFKAPDVIVVSVGDGNIISGVHKGLKDLLALAWIDHIPRLIGVQAEGSAALYNTWKAGQNPVAMQPIDAHTIADSISAGFPRDRVKAMRAVTETDGAYVSVTDSEILAAIPSLARETGIFAEPAGSASFAGLLKAREMGLIASDDSVVVLVTGNGLKDIASARKAVGEPHRVAANLDDVTRVTSEIFDR